MCHAKGIMSPRISINTPVGQQILSDFKNWRITGFSPWGKNIGGVCHYKSSQAYQIVSKNAFRSQAIKIAEIARKQMPAHEATDISDARAAD
mmetsp:Transcript_123055/g.353544  ORF Transcript_123055/g.353544 Transcript_123055/m.353544 type:complete len:92 (+) Transcript_123055:47-322(+)